VVLDANLRVQTANPAFYKTFHITPEETKDNLFYEIANHAWDIPELRSMLKDILPQKTTLTDFEVRQNFKDIGSKIMLLNACSVVRHTNDIPLFLLAIEDISERKYLEEELQEFSYKLTEAHRQKDEFLATLSHELRNPLAPMHNALEILRLPSKNPKIASQAYEIINYQLTKMVILVDDLLDISRITNGKIALRKEHTELEKIIKNAVETSLPLVESAKHKLTVILPEEPLWLHADPIRISQVLSNLLNNAAKYTKDNGAIQLSAERKENDILIHIKDNGIGLSSEVLPHIFKMFSQVDTSIDRAQDGMGVGLALVKNLVELHGGSIKVASEGLGYGAEFTVSLPWSSAPQGTKKTSSQIAKQESLKNKNGMRILVIDDNKASAQTLGWLLELDLGYKVELAYDGISAIALAKNFIPDVILLDIGLPGMNGYTICQTLHQEYILKDTIIIAQTGWGQEEHRKRSKEAGFDYHLVKPVSLDTLREVLNSIRTQKKIPLTCTG
jgi:two-component system CheB/CheR fusion protein